MQLASQWEMFVYKLNPDKWCIGSELKQLNMPDHTRIVALFRDNQLLHPSGSSKLMAGDVLCIIGHDADLPVLGRMFSETPQRNFDFEFFGDFMLDGAARLDDLAMFYSLDLADCGDALTLADFIAKKLGGNPVVGDTLQWSGMGWTVAELDGDQIRRVGVKAQGESAD